MARRHRYNPWPWIFSQNNTKHSRTYTHEQMLVHSHSNTREHNQTAVCTDRRIHASTLCVLCLYMLRCVCSFITSSTKKNFTGCFFFFVCCYRCVVCMSYAACIHNYRNDKCKLTYSSPSGQMPVVSSYLVQ